MAVARHQRLRDALKRHRLWAVGLLLASVLWPIGCKRKPSARDGVLNAARRVNGDVTIISLQPSFRDIDRVRSVALSGAGVDHASIFALWPVEFRSPRGKASALLKLVTISSGIAADLGLSTQPRPYAGEGLVELALGAGLARSLEVNTGDRVGVIVASGAGTAGSATVDCIVAGLFSISFPKYDDGLAVADLTAAARVPLLPTGIELRLPIPPDRGVIASRLQQVLGARYKVMPLEELVRPMLAGVR